eukprot:PITA_21512
MLKGRNLSDEYWVEAVSCVIYVINRYPTKSVMNKVLEQPWPGISCSVSHLRVFGCVAYTHVPKERRDDVAEKEKQESQGKTPNRGTPTRTPIFSEQHGSSSRSTNENSPNSQSGDESTNGKRKMRSLKDIYHDSDVSSKFSLLSFQPSSFEEVIKYQNWVQAMDEEIEAIEKNDTWDLIDLPKDENLIGVKWVYKSKLNVKGEIDRFKAILVAKGFLQQP